MKLIGSKYKKGSFLLAESLLNLNGTDQYVEIGNQNLVDNSIDFDGGDPHTYEMVLSVTSATQSGGFNGRVFSKGTNNNSIEIEFTQTNTFQILVRDTGFIDTLIVDKPISLNVLYHIVLVVNSVNNTLLFYINGKLEASKVVTDLSTRSIGKGNFISLGRILISGKNYFANIKVGLLRIYTKVLSPNEILMQSKEPLYVQKSLTSDVVPLLNVNKFANKETDILIGWSTLNN